MLLKNILEFVEMLSGSNFDQKSAADHTTLKCNFVSFEIPLLNNLI